MAETNGKGGWVEAYKATLRFIRSLAGLGAFVLVAWWVIPRLGGFCRWLSGIDREVVIWLVAAPVAGITLVCLFAIYAVFFRGTGFIERLVSSETAREAVRGKRRVTIDVEAADKPPGG